MTPERRAELERRRLEQLRERAATARQRREARGELDEHERHAALDAFDAHPVDAPSELTAPRETHAVLVSAATPRPPQAPRRRLPDIPWDTWAAEGRILVISTRHRPK